MKKFDRAMSFFEEYGITILLFLMTVITFWGVINRFFLKQALPWSEELARYLSIWAAMIGASLGVKKNVHIGIEAFVAFLPKRIQSYVSLLTIAISFIFCVAMVYVGGQYSMKLIKNLQLSAAMRIPIVIAYGAIPVGCLMMAVRYVMLFIENVSNFKAGAVGGGEGK